MGGEQRLGTQTTGIRTEMGRTGRPLGEHVGGHVGGHGGAVSEANWGGGGKGKCVLATGRGV